MQKSVVDFTARDVLDVKFLYKKNLYERNIYF